MLSMAGPLMEVAYFKFVTTSFKLTQHCFFVLHDSCNWQLSPELWTHCDMVVYSWNLSAWEMVPSECEASICHMRSCPDKTNENRIICYKSYFFTSLFACQVFYQRVFICNSSAWECSILSPLVQKGFLNSCPHCLQCCRGSSFSP